MIQPTRCLILAGAASSGAALLLADRAAAQARYDIAVHGFTNLPGAVSTSSGAMLEFAALG